MSQSRPILVSVLLLLATIVYVELRLPVPLDAQGRAAVYERVSVVDTALDAIRVAGGIVVATLRVTGDAILPANSVQEVEIDIGNAPTDDFFLQWDQTAGKPTWQEIGFGSYDWSGYDRSGSGLTGCPSMAGGTDTAGENAERLSQHGLTKHDTVNSLLIVAAQPYLNYDVTLILNNSNVINFGIVLVETTGVETTLASLSTGVIGGRRRITGKTALLSSGPVATILNERSTSGIYGICRSISRIWRTAT